TNRPKRVPTPYYLFHNADAYRNELQHDKSIIFDERGLWLRPEFLTTRAQREQPAAALPEGSRGALRVARFTTAS
ncbi:hypothetical protein E4U48_000615, partial [Claviceps purpurea]